MQRDFDRGDPGARDLRPQRRRGVDCAMDEGAARVLLDRYSGAQQGEILPPAIECRVDIGSQTWTKCRTP
jgi:hypothetical protein